MSDSLDDELMPFSIDYRSIVGYLQLQLRSNNKTADSAPGLATWEVTLTRDAENARHENARKAIVWNTECCKCLSIAEQECMSR